MKYEESSKRRVKSEKSYAAGSQSSLVKLNRVAMAVGND